MALTILLIFAFDVAFCHIQPGKKVSVYILLKVWRIQLGECYLVLTGNSCLQASFCVGSFYTALFIAITFMLIEISLVDFKKKTTFKSQLGKCIIFCSRKDSYKRTLHGLANTLKQMSLKSLSTLTNVSHVSVVVFGHL